MVRGSELCTHLSNIMGGGDREVTSVITVILSCRIFFAVQNSCLVVVKCCRKMFGKRTPPHLMLMICLVAGVQLKTENFFNTKVSKKFWDEAVQVAHTRHGVNRSVWLYLDLFQM